MNGADAAVSPTRAAPVWNWQLFWTLEIAGVFAVTALGPLKFKSQLDVHVALDFGILSAKCFG